MALQDLDVEAAALISDDSSFYGEDSVKAGLEQLAPSSRKRRHRSAANEKTRKTRLKADYESKKGSGLNEAANQLGGSSRESEPELRLSRHQSLRPGKSNILEAESPEQYSVSLSPFETIDEFLERLPVTDPQVAKLGHWLWVHCPSKAHLHHSETREDLDAFAERGSQLLAAFDTLRSDIESKNPGKPAGSITRKLSPHRDQLEQDILSHAIETELVSGKWMLFPNATDLPRYWRTVTEATVAGKLGPTSKVATYDPVSDHTLICVYTHSFMDTEDLRTVLDALVKLDLCSPGGKPIYYKCDAFTHLRIDSKNSYKLRASLYSSKDFFDSKSTAFRDGSIARIKRAAKSGS